MTQGLLEMITNIPESEDFFKTGIDLLNLSWDPVARLLTELDESESFGTKRGDVEGEYWKAAQRSLATSLSMAHQASDFLIKGRIASVSPFLLVAGQPKEWPRSCDSKDTPFADFRTIDAQELLRVHDTVYSTRLPDEFSELYTSLRRTRNTIMHTVDKTLSVHLVDLLITILRIHDAFVPERPWVESREDYLKSSPFEKLYGDYSFAADSALIWEMKLITELLKPAQLKRFFSFDPNARRYLCGTCCFVARKTLEHTPRTAQLRPNAPTSTKVWCFVCRVEVEVKREKCGVGRCKGNVISVEDGCLTCGS